MTVEHNSYFGLVSASDVVNHKPEALEAIVQAALINIAEASVDMVVDNQADYETRTDVQSAFNGLRDMTEDYLADMMDDLKAKVLERLKEIEFSTKVRSMEYDDGGLTDVSVVLNFKE